MDEVFRVFVKGDRFEAARAAENRGMGFDFEREIQWGVGQGTTTLGLVSSTPLRLNEWLIEDIGTGAPYPVGALLYWSQEGVTPNA